MNRIMRSLKNINGRMFLALIIMGLCPTLYTTLRTFFLGQLPGEWSYSIAGQLSWVNLLYEVINEAIILPLYFFMGQAVSDKEEYSNRIRSGLLISLGIYTVCSVLVMIFVDPLLRFMAVSQDILTESASYIRIECIANIFSILYSFICVALITIGKYKLVYAITAAKLILSIILDTVLVSSLPVSLKCGVNGIGISNIISNLLLFIIAAVLISRCGYPIFEKKKLSFAWMKDFFKIGSISGLESFVRNIAYMLMVSRMVNMVGEQGTYWVANNFIWGWMLLPITQLGELIKQETAKDRNAVRNNTLGYFAITAMTCLLWIVTIPLYKPFMQYVLNYSDVGKLFKLVMVLFVFYVLYAFQNVFDATFYGRGKTKYMLFESVVTNSIYYGAFFVLYLCGVWKPTLIGIALMFGFGNAFDTVVETKKQERQKESIEDAVRNHLRGFTRTIPSFLMAYGDDDTTLNNFDQIIPDEVFIEVTSITLDEFRFLRDGGEYTDAETGEKKHYQGKLFDEVVFNDSVKEFLSLKKRLADYFDESNEEDIFDYIPPQKTNQIFTPKKVVKQMVDMLEEENPGCFDDPDKTFADLYMKSGLYITEIVKRLYNNQNMIQLYPHREDRLNHIFEKQVYGLAPTEIIYRIALSYILGFDENIAERKHNFRMFDALPSAKDGTLSEKLDEIYH